MKHDFIIVPALWMLALLTTGCSQGDVLANAPQPGEEDILVKSDGATPRDNEGFTDAPDIPKDMTVIFEDDFVNSTGIPDEDKWTLCEKSTSNWSRYLSGSYDQAYTKDGSLFLVGERVDGQYLTGGIETRGKFDFEHGRVECRARFKTMPQGGHTGIWMMPAPPTEQWPKSGEIDIMEHLNKDDIIYQTVHSWYADDMGHKEDPKSQNTVRINKEDWNIFGLEWTADRITYTVNGVDYLSYPNLHLEGEEGAYQWPFNHPFYLILSQSLGGEGTWAGAIDNAELPAIFEIDWIRVLQYDGPHSGVEKIYPD